MVGCLTNRADVEEVVEETFIRAYRALAHFRGESSLATWLHQIAVNLARNRYWYLCRRRLPAPSLDAPLSSESNATLADLVASDAPDPSQDVDQEEFSAIVAACLDRLPAWQRDILKLGALFDGSHAAISTALGINIGTVKSRIARARHHLRAEVGAIAPEAPLRSASSF